MVQKIQKTLYLTSFLNTYGAHLENAVPAEVIQGLRYIVAASHVDNEEIFKKFNIRYIILHLETMSN